MNSTQAAFSTFDFGGFDGDEEQEERDGKSVVEAGFHIERLTDAHGHARAVHDNLSQAGVGRRKDSAQNSRFPDRQLRKHQPRDDCPQNNRQQHASA